MESFEGHLFLNIQGTEPLKMTGKGHPFSTHGSYVMIPENHNKKQNKKSQNLSVLKIQAGSDDIWETSVSHGSALHRSAVLQDFLDGVSSPWQWGSVRQALPSWE